ncbi:MAG: SoxR reducing system RseC family protein [Gammaproteobacteria bacterium]|nr:SoxR reducing system RseC family protein [Gammaproteobacteria bacterium]
MVSRSGIISKIDGAMVQVLFDHGGGCPSCDKGFGCGIVPLAGLLGLNQRRSLVLPVQTDHGLREGDRVQVDIKSGRLNGLMAAAYALPLAALLGGALLADALAGARSNDLVTSCGALIGMVSVIGALRLSGMRHLKPAWLSPEISAQ